MLARVVCLLSVIGGAMCAYDVAYTCDSTGVITIINPNVTVFLSATAAVDGVLCPLNMSGDYSTFTLSGCGKGGHIMFTLSDRDGAEAMGDGIIGGGYSETTVIQCAEISMDGVTFVQGMAFVVAPVTDKFGLEPTQEKFLQGAVTPIFGVTTSVWNNADNAQITEANVGDNLRWKIIGPYEYDVLPLTCTVYAGTAIGGTPNKLLITNGCSEDTGLVSHFTPISGVAEERGIIFSWFYAFRFKESPHLTLTCTVRTCPRGAANCAQTPCVSRRRRFATYTASDSEVTVSPDEGSDQGLVVTHLHVRSSMGIYRWPSSAASSIGVPSRWLMVPCIVLIVAGWMT